MPRLLSLITLVVLSLGCASTTVTRMPSQGLLRDVKLRHHIAVWGFWEISPPVDPDVLCRPGTWTKLNTKFDILGIGLGLITAGIYTPAVVTVSCQDPQLAK